MARNDTPTSVTRRFSNAGKATAVPSTSTASKVGNATAPSSRRAAIGLALRLAVLHELLGEGQLAPRRRLAPIPCQWCLCAPQEDNCAAQHRFWDRCSWCASAAVAFRLPFCLQWRLPLPAW